MNIYNIIVENSALLKNYKIIKIIIKNKIATTQKT